MVKIACTNVSVVQKWASIKSNHVTLSFTFKCFADHNLSIASIITLFIAINLYLFVDYYCYVNCINKMFINENWLICAIDNSLKNAYCLIKLLLKYKLDQLRE